MNYGRIRPNNRSCVIKVFSLSGNLTIASALGVALPNTATAQELFNACSANGGAKWDHSALVKALEKLANHAIAG